MVVEHLKLAIRRWEQKDQLSLLLGLAHLQMGNQNVARRWLTKAEEVAATDALKRNYSSKIDTLLSASRQ